MKSIKTAAGSTARTSHPARGAWIEITHKIAFTMQIRSHPARGAWIEIVAHAVLSCMPQSHPARGAWIEINLILK